MSIIMKTKGIATAIALLLAWVWTTQPLTAGTMAPLDDPLHGYPGVDNGTNTPVPPGYGNFGFTVSPGPATGDLLLDILVPNTVAKPASFTVHGTLSGGPFSGTATLFSATPWKSGDLDAYLGISAAPSNPFGAYSQPGVKSYFVFQVDLGTTTLQDASKPNVNPLLKITGSIPTGSYIVGFLNEGTAGAPNWIATANSGALFFPNGGLPNGNPNAGTPEPATLTMLGIGIAGMGGFWWRRKRSA
jgi:hypothetical protein